MVVAVALETPMKKQLLHPKKFLMWWAIYFCLSANAFAASAGLVVSGLGGTKAYDEQFYEQGESIVQALRTLEQDATAFEWLAGESAERETILTVLSKPSVLEADVFYLFLLGHGVTNSEGWWFNLNGPDLNTEDLVAALNQIKAKQQVVIVATSSSGALLELLSQPGRAVMTATKSAGEINAVRFPQYVAQAFESTHADTDRNELLTLAELWRYANTETQDYYKQEKLLASEHARLNSAGLESLVVAKMGALKAAKDNPTVAALLQQRLVLENKFLALKEQKEEIGIVKFYEQLEPLVLDIAKLQLKIDESTGWVEPGSSIEPESAVGEL